MNSIEVTLMDVMEFRELKASIQTEMRSQETDGIVVSLGMNIPGPIKSGPFIFEAFQEGKKSLEQLLQSQAGVVLQETVLEKKAGYAAIYLIQGTDRQELKKKTVQLEETHPLGRIFDIDVMAENGEPLTRETIGADRRRCLICGQDAKVCGRNRSHSVAELQGKVFEIIERWKVEPV